MPPKAVIWPGGHFVPGVGGKSRIEHVGEGRVARKRPRQRQSVRRVAFHPAGERAQAAQDEPGAERAGGPAEAPAGLADVVGEPVAGAGEDQGAAEHVAVAAQVLGGRMQDDVGTEGERPLQGGGREGAVDQEPGAGSVRRLGEAAEIEDLELRVGRCLGPDERGAGAPAPPPSRAASARSTKTGSIPQRGRKSSASWRTPE